MSMEDNMGRMRDNEFSFIVRLAGIGAKFGFPRSKRRKQKSPLNRIIVLSIFIN